MKAQLLFALFVAIFLGMSRLNAAGLLDINDVLSAEKNCSYQRQVKMPAIAVEENQNSAKTAVSNQFLSALEAIINKAMSKVYTICMHWFAAKDISTDGFSEKQTPTAPNVCAAYTMAEVRPFLTKDDIIRY